MKTDISIIRCMTYDVDEVYTALKKAIDLIGGINNFVKKNEKILVKPNLLSASLPESGIVTHPEFVRAVIRILKETGVFIYLGDSPSAWGAPEEIELVYEKSGIKRIAEEEKITLVKFNQGRIRGGYPLTNVLEECDGIVSLPKFKTHTQMILTAAIKNLFGMVVGMHKLELHRRALRSQDFARILVDVYSLIKPKLRLSLIDGIVGMEGDGPSSSGILRNFGMVLVGSDALALDSVLSVIMGLKPEEIYTNKEAKKRNLGIADLVNINILGKSLKDCLIPDFKLPATSILNKIPKVFLEMGKGFLKIYPKVYNNLCVECGLCVKQCPQKTMELKEEMGIVINYQNCISCFCCLEVCPQAAIKTKESLVIKTIRKIKWLFRL